MLSLAREIGGREPMFVPFKRITYTEAMEKYGSDKPDLRYDLAAVDVSDIAGKSAFPVFVSNVAAGKPVKVIRAPKMALRQRDGAAKADRRTRRPRQIGRARRAWRGWRCPKTKKAKSRDPSANTSPSTRSSNCSSRVER